MPRALLITMDLWKKTSSVLICSLIIALPDLGHSQAETARQRSVSAESITESVSVFRNSKSWSDYDKSLQALYALESQDADELSPTVREREVTKLVVMAERISEISAGVSKPTGVPVSHIGSDDLRDKEALDAYHKALMKAKQNNELWDFYINMGRIKDQADQVVAHFIARHYRKVERGDVNKLMLKEHILPDHADALLNLAFNPNKP